ncbi:MAG: hypothetical protein AAGD09_27075, partial [Cyanobacteria bacterium P01_F01_bin.56]
MGGSDYEEAVLRLLDIASLTQRMPQAEAALAQLDQPLTRSRQQLWQESRKTVLVMGISPFSHGCDRYPVETQSGTLGSVLQEFTHFPWSKPHAYQGEPGITYLSKQQIAQVNPDVIFVQSYGGRRSLKAVRTQQVQELRIDSGMNVWVENQRCCMTYSIAYSDQTVHSALHARPLRSLSAR